MADLIEEAPMSDRLQEIEERWAPEFARYNDDQHTPFYALDVRYLIAEVKRLRQENAAIKAATGASVDWTKPGGAVFVP